MKFDVVADKLRGIPNMGPSEGKLVYQHIIDNGVIDVLELGTAHGVSAAYAAAALDELGRGRVVTVDSRIATASRDPQPGDVLRRCGLDQLVERVLVDDSSYTWWLKQRVAEQSDEDGNCEPLFDFCYLDGAHNWTIDGLAVILVEKLLRRGGWLLLDDLDWFYEPVKSTFGPGQGPRDLNLSTAECSEPHIRAVYELLVKQHPSFTTFYEQGNQWGWAKKDPDAERSLTVRRTMGAASVVDSAVRKARRVIGSASGRS